MKGLLNEDFHEQQEKIPQDQIIIRNIDKVNVMEEESMRIFYNIIHNELMDDINLRKKYLIVFNYDAFINDILSGSASPEILLSSK